MPKFTSRRARFLALGLAVAMALGLTVGVVTLEGRLAHAAGTGPQFACVPTGGQPTCHFKGAGAQVEIETNSDPNGCILTEAGVFVQENVTHDPPGPPTGGPFLVAQILKIDQCQGQLLEDIFGSTSDVAFKAVGSLETASLDAEIPSTDFLTGNPATISVHLTWRGAGPVSSGEETHHLRSAAVTVHSHLIGDSRLALATGTLSDGATNFASSPVFGLLFDNQSGTVEITQQ